MSILAWEIVWETWEVMADECKVVVKVRVISVLGTDVSKSSLDARVSYTPLLCNLRVEEEETLVQMILRVMTFFLLGTPNTETLLTILCTVIPRPCFVLTELYLFCSSPLP